MRVLWGTVLGGPTWALNAPWKHSVQLILFWPVQSSRPDRIVDTLFLLSAFREGDLEHKPSAPDPDLLDTSAGHFHDRLGDMEVHSSMGVVVLVKDQHHCPAWD